MRYTTCLRNTSLQLYTQVSRKEKTWGFFSKIAMRIRREHIWCNLLLLRCFSLEKDSKMVSDSNICTQWDLNMNSNISQRFRGGQIRNFALASCFSNVSPEKKTLPQTCSDTNIRNQWDLDMNSNMSQRFSRENLNMSHNVIRYQSLWSIYKY